MPSTEAHWTAEMVRALPDDGTRYEVIDGELLVTPSPRRPHQRAVLQIAKRLDDYVEAIEVGTVLVSPSDIELDPHGMVQPDVFVEGLVDDRAAAEWNAGAPLLLVVEVLSPGTARTDRITKRDRYRRAGIPEYWIVDLDARTIERWRPGDTRPEVLSETIVWHPSPHHDPLILDLDSLFRRIHRDAR